MACRGSCGCSWRWTARSCGAPPLSPMSWRPAPAALCPWPSRAAAWALSSGPCRTRSTSGTPARSWSRPRSSRCPWSCPPTCCSLAQCRPWRCSPATGAQWRWGTGWTMRPSSPGSLWWLRTAFCSPYDQPQVQSPVTHCHLLGFYKAGNAALPFYWTSRLEYNYLHFSINPKITSSQYQPIPILISRDASIWWVFTFSTSQYIVLDKTITQHRYGLT